MSERSDAASTAGGKVPKDFLVAGLGGSAGSILSFREFFRNVPADSGIAYVVILHLSPEFDSHLAEVLQKSASIPVTQVREPVTVEPNHVYVIPPNKSMSMNDGSLFVSDVTGFKERRAPVDIFFRTLADTRESHAVCVILSGSGADGSMGLRRIKENNGLVLVQDPAEAEFDEMPRSSIVTGLVDFILPVAEMPARMMAYRDQIGSASLAVDSRSEDDEHALIEVFTILRMRTGQDFTNYKRATVLRRIERRMAAREIARLPEYAQFLREQPEEADALLRELLISVTNFFRDAETWAALEETIVPKLLEEYAAPSLIVDEQYDIMHLSERAGKYLQFGGGEASLNLLQVARTELRIELRTVLAQAMQKKGAVAARGLRVHTGDRFETIDVIVRPVMRDGDPVHGYFLVLFEDARDPVDAPSEATAAEPMARQMEEELIRIKTQMRGNIEQYEMQVEEARAANEELQAINEELRSTAEELETSQEELQSVNEELQTVNQELKVKVDEVSHANNDMRNLMSSTEIGTMFVDRGLTVKLFTPRIRDIFNLIPADVGRSLLDITSKLTIDNLAADAETVLDRLNTIEREVQTRNGRWHLMRLLPCRTAEDRIAGVVVTFVDITERKQTEEALRASEERHRAIVTAARDYAIVTTDIDGRIISWSPGAEAIFGWSEAEALGQPLAIIFTPEDQAAAQPEKEQQTARARGSATDKRWHMRKNGSRVFVDGTMRVLTDAIGAPRGFLKIGTDVTQRRNTEEALRDSEARLKAVANVVPDLIWSSDAGGSTDWFNERWSDYTGQTFAEARGYGWLEAIHPDDRAATREGFRRALDSGERLREEHRIRSSRGEYRWFLVQAEPLRNADGEIVRWFGASTDIHEQRMARDILEERVRVRTRQLEDLSAQRQQLLERLVTATEEERRRIARELHDVLGQHLTALRMAFEAVRPQDDSLAGMSAMMQRLDETMDRLTSELRPPALDHLGLHGAITSLAHEFYAASGLRVDVHLPGVDGERFTDAIETTIYRVVQEGLTNVRKHAHASTVSIIVERDGDSLRMILEDNGRGFDSEDALAEGPGQGHFGLLGIRERLALVRGSLDVESQPDSGTTLYVRVPLPDAKTA